MTESFDSPAALRKAQQEVGAFHRFQELCGQLIEVSEKICALRPVEETLTPGKKTAQTIQSEVAREVNTLLGPVPQIPAPTLVCRLRGDRSRL